MKIVILTMMNQVEIIGELKTDPQPSSIMPLYQPAIVQVTPPNKVTLHPILRGSQMLSGSFSMVNMSAVMWINEPADQIRQAYLANRAGLTVSPKIAVGLNG